MVTSIRLVRVFHAALAGLATFAVISRLVVDIHLDRSLLNTLSYFTNQANILVAVSAAFVALDPLHRGVLHEALRLAGLVGITITGVVYYLLLGAAADLEGADVWISLLLHKIIPVATVLGFLLLKPRSPLGPKSWWFVVWPIAWLGYTLIRAEVSNAEFERLDGTSRAPYDFLDHRAIGWGSVGLHVVAIVAVSLLLARGLIWLSWAGSARDEQTSPEPERRR
jgi:hypothetical protein